MKQLIILVLLCCSLTAAAQTSWHLKKDAEDIKVYVADMEGSKLKAVKVTCTLDGTLSQLTALLMDAEAHEKWVYSTEESYLIKDLGPGHQIYYSVLGMPWPVEDRDVVVELKISQAPESKVLKVSSVAVDGYKEPQKGKIRVPQSSVHWTVTPDGPNRMKVEYIAQADPGGAIPTWMANMVSTKGPFETFVALRKLLPSYRDISVAYVQNQ